MKPDIDRAIVRINKLEDYDLDYIEKKRKIDEMVAMGLMLEPTKEEKEA